MTDQADVCLPVSKAPGDQSNTALVSGPIKIIQADFVRVLESFMTFNFYDSWTWPRSLVKAIIISLQLNIYSGLRYY